jgi:dihydrofolate reductase (trimethoprim resistance protein)
VRIAEGAHGITAAGQEGGAHRKFKHGDRVRKTKGSEWSGYVVGWYSTTLTPDGYAVESETHKGSVQIYPASALELLR